MAAGECWDVFRAITANDISSQGVGSEHGDADLRPAMRVPAAERDVEWVVPNEGRNIPLARARSLSDPVLRAADNCPICSVYEFVFCEQSGHASRIFAPDDFSSHKNPECGSLLQLLLLRSS